MGSREMIDIAALVAAVTRHFEAQATYSCALATLNFILAFWLAGLGGYYLKKLWLEGKGKR